MFEILSTCKGGGYLYCRTNPKHPKSNSKGLYPLHRVIAENKIGRLLFSNEDVHHIDEDKSNNNPENLAVLSKSEHAALHQKIDSIALDCPICNSIFRLKPYQYRLRSKRSKSGWVYCSRKCGIKSMTANCDNK